MTKVVFYSNVDDKFAKMLSLIQQALKRNQQVTVLTDSEAAASRLSDRLWASEAIGFVPNVLATHTLAPKTPVIIHWMVQSEQLPPLFQDDILVNLTAEQPMFFSRFKSLIELVGQQEDDKVAARSRYKFYRDRGYEIQHTEQAHLTQ